MAERRSFRMENEGQWARKSLSQINLEAKKKRLQSISLDEDDEVDWEGTSSDENDLYDPLAYMTRARSSILAEMNIIFLAVLQLVNVLHLQKKKIARSYQVNVLHLQKKKITEEHRTEDPIPEISIDMSREVTERDLSEISQAIGSEWKLLGAALGITEVEMEHIDCDNKATPMKIFSMLTKWRRENDATVNTLYNAIQNCRPAVTFDMKVIERVFAQRN